MYPFDFFKNLLYFSILFFLPYNLTASHVAGAEFNYTYLGQGLYQLEFKMYRDACGTSAPASLTARMTNSCGWQAINVTMNVLPGGAVPVHPFCTALQSQNCLNGGTLSAYELYVYEGYVVLGNCTQWTYEITDCCRNAAITNLTQGGTLNYFLRGTINTTRTNSSVVFQDNPVVFTCPNQTVTFNLGIYDPENDNISVSWTAPLDGGFPVSFVAPFTFQSPMPLDSLHLDTQTGRLTLVPNLTGVYAFALAFEEYRNGVLLSRTIRDYQVNVLPPNYCLQPNDAPEGTLTNVNGGNEVPSDYGYDITVCQGTTLEMEVVFEDADTGNILTFETDVLQALPGSVVTVTGNNPMVVEVDWNVPMPYLDTIRFYLSASDSVCPVSLDSRIWFRILPSRLTAEASRDWLCVGDTNTRQLSVDIVGVEDSLGTFSWAPALGLNDPTIADPVATVTQEIDYAVTYSIGLCQLSDTVQLRFLPFSFTLPPLSDSVVCYGDTVTLVPQTPNPFASSFSNFNGQTIIAGISTLIPIQVSNLLNTVLQPGALLTVNLDIAQNFTGHLSLYLISPSGQTVLLSSSNGGLTNCGYRNMTFSPSANISVGAYAFTCTPANATLQPEALNGWNNLLGSTTNGTWYLQITHLLPGANGGQNGQFYNVTINFLNSGDYTFNWSDGSTNATLPVEVLGTDTYHVTVTDAAGCVEYASATLGAYPNVVGALVDPDPLCPNGLIDIVAPAGFVDYNWSNGATGDTLFGAGPGIYGLSVTDTNNCTSTDTVEISETTVPLLSFNGSTIQTGNYPSYAWYLNGSPILGANGPTYDVQANGDYYVVVVDSAGCSLQSDTLSIIQLGSIQIEAFVRIFPNPASHSVTLSWEGLPMNTGDFGIQCHNTLGQTVPLPGLKSGEMFPNGQIGIDVSLWPAGLYTLSVYTGGRSYAERFLVSH